MLESDFAERLKIGQKQTEEELRKQFEEERKQSQTTQQQANSASVANPNYNMMSFNSKNEVDTINSPYAYNFPQDRPTGITAYRPKREITSGKSQFDSSGNIDLQALANINVTTAFNENDNTLATASNPMAKPGYGGNNNNNVGSLGMNKPPTAGNNNHFPMPWTVDRTGGDNMKLGLEEPLPLPPQSGTAYPQSLALRSPDEEDFQNMYRNNNGNNNGPRPRGYTPEPMSRYPYDDMNNNPRNFNPNNAQTTPNNMSTGLMPNSNTPGRRQPSPLAPQNMMASVLDHPLRNALRQEVKANSSNIKPVLPNTFASAPSPYTAVKSKVVTNNPKYAKTKPPPNSTGMPNNTRYESPRNRQRNGSPPDGNVDDYYYETGRLPASNMPGADMKIFRSTSPSRFMSNTNSWKLKINPNPTPHHETVIRAANWK
jgi:hypothetical protein